MRVSHLWRVGEEGPGRGSSRAKPGGRAFPEAGCLQDASACFLKERQEGQAQLCQNSQRSGFLPPTLLCRRRPHPRQCGAPQARLLGGVGPAPPHACRLLPSQLCPRAQGGVGTEPRAPAHWPSSNLPGDDRLQYLMRTRMRTPNKNKKITQPDQQTSLLWAASQAELGGDSSGLWAELSPLGAGSGEERAG